MIQALLALSLATPFLLNASEAPPTAASLMKSSRLAEAEELCFQRAQRAPEEAEGWYQLGLVRASRGHYREAADAQRLAVSRSPRFGQAYCALALDLRQVGKTQEGFEAATAATQLLPAYAGSWNLLGNFQMDLRLYDEAETSYRRAIALEPAYPNAWINLGLVLEKDVRLGEARQAYDKAVSIDPARLGSREARAELALAQGDLDLASLDFQAMAADEDYAADGHGGLQRVAKARKDEKMAAREFKLARQARREQDKASTARRAAGLEVLRPYEPGLPLGLVPTPTVTATVTPGAQP